jgi:endonuclease/exonuclease/phosphatase family metal-dependent hydrolase
VSVTSAARSRLRGCRGVLAALSYLWLVGCATVRIEPLPALPPCRTTAPASAPEVRWLAPYDGDDRKSLLVWCEPVGPVVRYDAPGTASASPSAHPLVVVSWNMAVGAGSLLELIAAVRASEGLATDLVVLLQEAYRAGGAVPPRCPSNSGVARRIAPATRPDGADVVELAARLALHGVYVPSMRNGSDCAEPPHEDRGNAILSTLPLVDIASIELPFAQQRRVAVAATVGHGSRRVNVVSLHFDTLRGHKGQARAIVQALDALAWRQDVVIGGDFNARPFDPGIREMKKHFVEADCGSAATHTSGRRLDRLFTRGLSQPLTCARQILRFGSDHHALVARLPGL